MLVGADGAGSRVARQLLPGAGRIDTGIVAISGRFALDDQARRETPAAVFRGPTLIIGPAGVFMFASAVEYPPEAKPIYDTDEYVMWGISARRRDFGLDRSPDSLDPEAARALALRHMDGWAPALRWMIERANPAYMTAFAVNTSAEVGPWPTRNVTLLGDALHNMTPFRGMGANAALYDADLLTKVLVARSCGRRTRHDRARFCSDARFARRHELAACEVRAAAPRDQGVLRHIDIAPPLQRAFRGTR